MKLYFYGAFIVLLCLAPLRSSMAQTVITQPADIVRNIEHNFDIKRLEENTRKAESVLNRRRGSFYYPEINAEASYIDNQRQPLSPFLPARSQDVFWQFYLKSELPAGVSLSAGKHFTRSYYSQSDPPNQLLPYPATYYQPDVFVQASLNLTRDFLGAMTRKELEILDTNVQTAMLQQSLVKHKLTTTALGLYYQIPLLYQIRNYSKSVIVEFNELEHALTQKVERSLAEKSDLYNIEAVIAGQESTIKDTDQAIVDIKQALVLLLGDPDLSIEPSIAQAGVQNKINRCEQAVLGTPFATQLSREFVLLEENKKRAELQAKIYQRNLLPDVNLNGVLSTSGTDATYGKSLSEVGSFDYPYYEVGLKFVWQPSPRNFKSAKQASQVERNTAHLQEAQRLAEQKSLWTKTQQNIRILKKQQTALAAAIHAGELESVELREQYLRGRLSLFELVQRRVNLLRSNIELTNLRQEQLSRLVDALQYFDQFECGLTAANARTEEK